MSAWDTFIEYVFGPIWAFIRPLLREGFKQELAALLPIALDVVREIAADPSGWSNETKRAMAFSKILERAGAASLTVGAAVINLALELAVQNLKEPPK